tara:strand:- start:253 stop:411 length:159 start_codon:yes stop_codon:yes gene_type:complete
MALKKIVREAKEIWDEGKEFVTEAKEAWRGRDKNYREYMGLPPKTPKKKKGY